MKESVRRSPRISVNKLGEYAAADNASRRHQIVANQHKPMNSIVPFYTPAEVHITDFLVGGCVDAKALLNKSNEMRKMSSPSSWYERRHRLCPEAIEAFLSMHKDLDIHECELFKGEKKPPKLHVEGVSVSVRPEVLLTHKNRAGTLADGAVKLYISKSHPMTEEAGLYTATVLRQYVEEFLPLGHPCDRRYCFVLDVFAGSIFVAPPSCKKRWKSIEASCGEISGTWQRLSA